MQSIGDELSNGTQDPITLEHRLRDKTVQVSVGFLKVVHTEHHIDAISMSNDAIAAGDGDDLVIGDALVVRAIANHPRVDFDVLSFIGSPWAAYTPLPAPNAVNAAAPTFDVMAVRTAPPAARAAVLQAAGSSASAAQTSWLNDFILSQR